MVVPGILFVIFVGLGGCSVLIFGPVLSDLLLLSILLALTSLVLLLRAWFGRRYPKPRNGVANSNLKPRAFGQWRPVNPRKIVRVGETPDPLPEARARRKSARAKTAVPERWLVVDGSNVMHWKDEAPQIATVREVVQALTARGYSPGVVFDANAGYKIAGRYQDDAEMALQLGLNEDRVFVVPKGTQADPFLLSTARKLGARVVTNDRVRDWTDAHPEVREPGYLMRGGYREGVLWLEDGAPE